MTQTADEMVSMLRAHYVAPNRPPSGLYAAEVGSPDGRRRADALWLPLVTSAGSGLFGHEIKISRADVLRELEDPSKAEPWLQYCSRWWLVVSDPSLVDGLTVPDAWGVLAPPSGRRRRSMTVLREAPRLHPKEPALGITRLLAWHYFRTHGLRDEHQKDVAWRDREIERLRDHVNELRAAGNGVSDNPAAARVRGIVLAVDKAASNYTPDRPQWYRADDALIVEGIVRAHEIAAVHERTLQDLARLRSQLEDPLSAARAALEEAGT